MNEGEKSDKRSKGFGVRAPDGHPRRCQSYPKNKGGEQCRNWALRGAKYCGRHGGRRQLVSLMGANSKVSGFYSKRLGGPLREFFEEARDAGKDISEELALARAALSGSVELISKLIEASGKNDKVTPDMLVPFYRVMLEQADAVGKLGERAARVDAMFAARVPADALQTIVDQIIRVIYKETDGDEELAERIGNAIRDHVRLPTRDDGQLTMGVNIMLATTPTPE